MFIVLSLWNIDGDTAALTASVVPRAVLPMSIAIDTAITSSFIPKLAATIVLAIGAIYIAVTVWVLKTRAP